MALTVSQLAQLAGVSVRTLHHYDEIGLLRPSARGRAGRRRYETRDLVRLQQILFFKELGFPLDEVRRLLDDRGFDLRSALELQRQLLHERAARTTRLLGSIHRALDALDKGETMTPHEMFAVFGEDDPTRHEAEAQQRWGETASYRESRRRTASYGPEQWAAIKAEGDAITTDLARLAASGARPDGEAAQAIAERHRQHIDRWFYPCAPAMHRALGEMYVADPRFAASYERYLPGLAVFAREAWRANAETQSL